MTLKKSVDILNQKFCFKFSMVSIEFIHLINGLRSIEFFYFAKCTGNCNWL